MASLIRYFSRQKAGIKANKERKLRKQNEREEEKVLSMDGDSIREKDQSLEPETEMDLGDENWAKSPSKKGLNLDFPESQDSI